jgi:hypothetical protein
MSPKKQGTKATVLPPPPIQPIPPGEHPPVYTREEAEAQRQSWAEWEHYVASHFALEDLQEIVVRAGAPTLQDTFNTQAILRTVCGGIHNRLVAAENTAAEKHMKRHQNRRKEWTSIRKHLTTLETAQRWHINWFAERPWYGPEGKKFREDLLAKVEAVSQAMDAVEGYLFISPQKTRGKHGGMILANLPLGVDIFVRLPWAWEEAGVTRKISDAKRYEIVCACMGKMNEQASVDAVKKAITKHLRAYPYHTEKRDGNSL